MSSPFRHFFSLYKPGSLTLIAAASMASIGILLLAGCAQQGYPSGGPKDETPPTVLATEPPSGSTNFVGKAFTIHCDEYVQMKEADNNVLISPPMKPKPEYKVVGHNIKVKFRDSLQANTTYLFQFKGAIVDFNEGNPLESFEYALATGAQIDSMMLRGEVLDAVTLQPRKEIVTVLAYAADTLPHWDDSTVVKRQPQYVTRCDAEGHFVLNHLRAGQYRIIALEDANLDLLLDASEAVAFLDSNVTAYPMPRPADTTKLDTATTTASDTLDHVAMADSTQSDSTTMDSTKTIPSAPNLRMLMSLEEKVVQRIVDKEFVEQGHARIIASRPMAAPHFVTDSPCLYQYSRTADTLDFWMRQRSLDTLRIQLSDSSGIHDTIRLIHYTQKNTVGKTNLKGPRPKTPSAKVKSGIGGTHPYWDTLWVVSATPLHYATPDSNVSVLVLKDSSTTHCNILLDTVADSNRAILRARLAFRGHEGEKYQFTLPAGALTDIYGHCNDTLKISTELSKGSDYGTITMTLHGSDSMPLRQPNETLLLQLMDEKGNVLQQHSTLADTTISIPHLKPGKYTLCIVLDRNGDGHWTAGDYWQHRQPEPILAFGKTLDLRANWEMTEKWELAPQVNGNPKKP